MASIKPDNAMEWLQRGRLRHEAFLCVKQPFTVCQLARDLQKSWPAARFLLRELELKRLVKCLNRDSGRRKVYWLTWKGIVCHRRLRKHCGMSALDYRLPDLDWALYGGLCYTHRAAVVKVLEEPLQAVEIRRRACARDPRLRLSANNVRDVLKALKSEGVVAPVQIKKKAHTRFQLTESGAICRRFLLQARIKERIILPEPFPE